MSRRLAVGVQVMYAEPLGSRAPGAHRTPPPGSASRPARSDSLESAAHGLASPIGALPLHRVSDCLGGRDFTRNPAPDDPVLTAVCCAATAEDETSSRHRPLPTPDDPILPSPLRFPLPTSIGERSAQPLAGASMYYGRSSCSRLNLGLVICS